MDKENLVIGLFGFGVVGEGIYKVIEQTPALHARVKKICIKDPQKERDAPEELFTTRKEDILNDAGINLVVELISDADEAFTIVSAALKEGKVVVSANKKMIAEHLPELLHLQKAHNTSLLYEAAVCGSVPIIRNLEEYYDNDLLQGICGIVNGSTNYILTKIISEGLSYTQALARAQALGFAESDPALDVEGGDAANKLTILLLHAYGIVAHPDRILYGGITAIGDEDAVFAEEKGYGIKLAAQARRLSNGKVAAFVLPQFVTDQSQLYHVHNEYNGVVIETSLADKQFLYGKGAGRYPTASAVLSDISALRYGYRYAYKKRNRGEPCVLTDDYYLEVYLSFKSWRDLDRKDFESLEEIDNTQGRQAAIGLVHAGRLLAADWFKAGAVSLIVLPNGIVESPALLQNTAQGLSLQTGGF